VTRFLEARVERTCVAGALWERERERAYGWDEKRGRVGWNQLGH
jgi:hypothetical protein